MNDNQYCNVWWGSQFSKKKGIYLKEMPGLITVSTLGQTSKWPETLGRYMWRSEKGDR